MITHRSFSHYYGSYNGYLYIIYNIYIFVSKKMKFKQNDPLYEPMKI